MVTLNLSDDEAEELMKLLAGQAETERHDHDNDAVADTYDRIYRKLTRART